ncbi:MAG TPA: heavy-metal-associated domain-containing protein [Ramlibacter sp.]|nr:heavy-metal-associated domain-containing protein [Ramlibacter sp.]
MIEFDVQAMSCGHCVRTVTEAIQRIDPQARIEVDLAGKKVRVESSADRQKLVEALTEEGYPPAP